MEEKKNKYDPQTDYVPEENRVVKHPTNYFETILHFVKASIGTGILAMPNGFKDAGYIVGMFGTLFIGVCCIYCLRLLVTTQYELCRRYRTPAMTYTMTAAHSVLEGPISLRSFGYMSLMSNIFVLGFQIGAACIYLIFVSSNLLQIIEYHMDITMNIRVMMLIVLIPILLVALVNNLKYLAIFSLFADVATLIGFMIVIYYLVTDLPSLQDRNAFGQVKNYPLFIGTVVFAMEAIGVVLPLENDMKKPQQFTSLLGVLNVSLFPIAALYAFVGFLGYLKYGENAEGSLTLNLPTHEAPAQVSKVFLSFAIFITYSLALFVAYDIIWRAYVEPCLPNLDKDSRRCFWYQYLLRVALIIFTYGLAALIPKLALFISLVGSLCLASAGFMFPAVFSLLTHWYDDEGCKFKWLLTKMLTVIIMGILIMIIGVVTSISDIVEEMIND